jgi:hypothetical protein
VIVTTDPGELFAAGGATESHVPPAGLVAALVVKDTTAGAAGPVKVMGCVKDVVEPCTADGVQEVAFGVTVGGGVPVATIVAFERLKTVVDGGVVACTAVIVPVTGVPDGIAAGTAVTMYPVGIVTLAETVATAKLQLSMLIVSGALTLSVSVNTAAGKASQAKVASVTATPLYELDEELPVEVLLEVGAV